jgi:hypothetical protein
VTTTRTPHRKMLSAADKAFRRQCAMAVLTGIYSSHGSSIMEADREQYKLAIRTARRVAYEQADEMIRGEGDV